MKHTIQDAAGSDYCCDTLWKKKLNEDSAAKIPPSFSAYPSPVPGTGKEPPPPVVSVTGKRRLSSAQLLSTMRGEHVQVMKKQATVNTQNKTLILHNSTFELSNSALKRELAEMRELNAIATATAEESFSYRTVILSLLSAESCFRQIPLLLGYAI